MVEVGTMFVSCQHSYCIGCIEEWRSGSFLHGQGNYCFAKANASDSWIIGSLVSVFSDDSIKYLPVKADSTSIVLLEGFEAEGALNSLSNSLEKILENGFVESTWDNYCSDNANNYVWQILEALELRPVSIFLFILNELGLLKPNSVLDEYSFE